MNTGQIFKCKADRNYTKLPNSMIQSKTLSMDAKCLCAFLLSLPEDWVVNKTSLPDHFKEGKHRVYNAFDELIDAGYILRTEIFNGNLRAGYNYIVYDEPTTSDSRTSEIRTSEARTAEEQPLQRKQITKETKTKETLSGVPSDFLDIWDRYGKKVDKHTALRAWRKLSEQDKINALAAVDGYVRFTPELKYRKNLATWLNGKCWEDQLPSQGNNPPKQNNSCILG